MDKERLNTKNAPKKILDACCGGKMFWYNKNHPDVLYVDNREIETTLCDGRKFKIEPDEIVDFREMPYKDNTFKMVVFDPPHLVFAGKNSWLKTKYGTLPLMWQEYIKSGFDECMRVLEPDGILIFKWNEEQIQCKDVFKAIGSKPLLGDKRSKTRWMVYMKEASQ